MESPHKPTSFTVLVADDDPSALLLMKKVMLDEGYEVIAAQDGAAAIVAFDESHPDIALLDGMMPEKNGFEVCRYIRSQPHGKEMPVLLVTALDDDHSVNQAFDVGATDYIPKPVKWAVMRQRVRHLVYEAKAREQAIQLDMEKERANLLSNFIRDASHDIRTPLAGIKIDMFLLQNHAESEKTLGIINRLNRQIQHLEKVLIDMLAISSLDIDTSGLSYQRIFLDVFLDSLCTKFEQEIEEKELTVGIHLGDHLPELFADSTMLEQALSKILDNAIQYTPKGGQIEIEAQQNEKQTIITFADSGRGIAPENLPRIFDRFFRENDARTADEGGTGLGLSIAKRIIEIHGGQIEAESIPDDGTLIRVILPDNQPESAT